jgi:flavin reductase (DIM6/NTAB) family NADH-FMN oxidoreductase RutF
VFVKFSKPARYEDGKLNERPVRPGRTGSPIFEEAIAWMECEVRHSTDLGTHTFFVGEMVDAGLPSPDVEKAAAIGDTRMKYGGVKRGGH